ncbi:MAG: methyltransferase domain-containing protein [Kouleothrix sp.]|nr:methyltransferase domain-containing protein [Kouleothrix sp.]
MIALSHRDESIPERLVPGTLAWNMYEYEHKQRYEFFAPLCRSLAVLDAACGVGYGSSILAKFGAASVVGADISKEAVGYARRHFARPGVQFVHCDVERLSIPPHSVDVVISFETIEHLEHPRIFMEQVRSVLRPNGLFVCSTPNRDFFDRAAEPNPHHLHEMSFDEFTDVFGQYFDIEERYYQTHSDAYRRHIQLLRELGYLTKPVRFSKFLRFENFMRRSARQDSWSAAPLSSELARAVAGDYVIEPLDRPLDSQLTFIFVGRARSNA